MFIKPVKLGLPAFTSGMVKGGNPSPGMWSWGCTTSKMTISGSRKIRDAHTKQRLYETNDHTVLPSYIANTQQ